MMLYTGLSNLFDLSSKDWSQVRREMTDEKIATAYRLYEGLWPLETDLLSLLPKPDGRLRSVYTGSLHPQHIHEFALRSSLYFGEILIRHPFMHSGVLNKKYRPTDHPRQYRSEFVSTLYFFLSVMPFVEAGLINLVPNPCDFDFHLRDQTMAMARARSGDYKLNASTDPHFQELQRDLHKRMLLTLPEAALRRELEQTASPNASIGIDDMIESLDWMRENDPFVSLQEDTLGPGAEGQLHYFKMEPSFEVAMYLAQATGSQILTDSKIRWKDLEAALMRRHLGSSPTLTLLKEGIQSVPIAFPFEVEDTLNLHDMTEFSEVRSVLRNAFKYLKGVEKSGEKPNFETQMAARYSRQMASAQRVFQKAGIPHVMGHLQALMPAKGIQDNSINRLLLMSNAEYYLPSVPMAIFIDRVGSSLETNQ